MARTRVSKSLHTQQLLVLYRAFPRQLIRTATLNTRQYMSIHENLGLLLLYISVQIFNLLGLVLPLRKQKGEVLANHHLTSYNSHTCSPTPLPYLHNGICLLFSYAKRNSKTYNSGYSPVVTHLTTNPPVYCLSTAERTGSSIFSIL
jgi:hypothetical protein